MRVDTSLLDGINAATRAAKASSATLKSSGTTTSFSSALKSASEEETTKAVPGTNYHEILTGPRAGMYLNKSGNARDGEAFILVKHDGREDHIYGTGKDRKVVSVGEKSAAAEPAEDTAEKTSSTSTSADGAAPGERTKPVAGHAYADILNGRRSGLFINTSGNARDGEAFVLVKRKDHEYHIYGSGKDREVFAVKRQPETKTSTDTTTKTPSTTTPATTGTTPTGPLVTDSLS